MYQNDLSQGVSLFQRRICVEEEIDLTEGTYRKAGTYRVNKGYALTEGIIRRRTPPGPADADHDFAYPDLLHEFCLIQAPMVDNALLPILDVRHRAPNVRVPAAVALVDLPAADEVQPELACREREV